MIQAALHEVNGSLRQAGITAVELDLPLPDVSVPLPAELRVERTVCAEPTRRQENGWLTGVFTGRV